jgi:DNA-directed RNA polymerase subunit delta
VVPASRELSAAASQAVAFLIDEGGALRILPVPFRPGAHPWVRPCARGASPGKSNVNGVRVAPRHMPEGAMIKKKGIPDDEDFGPIPDDEAEDYDEDDDLFEDDDLEDDEEFDDEDDFDDEFEEEEYEEDEDELEDEDGEEEKK